MRTQRSGSGRLHLGKEVPHLGIQALGLTASVSASDLTSAAVARASVLAPATRLIASAPLCASTEARLTPSAIDDTAAFCSSTVTATADAMVDISVMMALTCSIACAASAAAAWIAPICSAISSVAARSGGERLHLGRDHREAAAGLAGAGGLDRGVEREQVCLAGDRLDQPDHLADTRRGVAELGHGLGGAPRFGDGAACHLGRFGGLAGDLPDRGGEFLDRTRRRRHVLRGRVDAILGGDRFRGHRIGRAVQFGRGRFQPLRGAAQLASAWSTEFEGGDVEAIVSLRRFSRAVGLVADRRSRS